MEDEKKNLFKNILGLSDKTALSIGLPLTATGLIASLLTNYKGYEAATKTERAQIEAIPGIAEKRNAEIEAGMQASLGKYGEMAQKQTAEGLAARGITDPAVAKSAAQQTSASLSGAYAAASGALARAKVNAQSSLGSAMVNYKTALAQRQYDSIMKEYAGKMGIWGALGGLGVGVMGLKGPASVSPEAPARPTIDTLGTSEANPELAKARAKFEGGR